MRPFEVHVSATVAPGQMLVSTPDDGPLNIYVNAADRAAVEEAVEAIRKDEQRDLWLLEKMRYLIEDGRDA